MAARLAPVTDQARTRPLLLLIDGHSMAYRAFFALPVENFSTRTGQPTNAVYGFTAMLANLLRDEAPTHVAVAFDAGRTTFRTEQYPAYKGTRDATPQEFQGQVPLIREILETMRITTLQREGFEADDIIATLSTQAQADGMDVLVCTGDRDALQLVGDDVTVLYPRKGVSDLVRFTPEAVQEKYGVPPASYPDLAALVGESSDNLPGVPGVGPKTAAKWILAHGGLDGVLAAAPTITGKAGESLRACADQVRVNRMLNAAVRDVELPVAVGDLAARPWDREAMHQVFDALEFRTLRERLFAMVPEEVGEAEGFQLDVVSPAAGALASWLEARHGRRLAVEVAGTSAPGRGDAWALAVADGADHAVVLELAELSPDDEGALARWLGDSAQPKSVHGAKDAMHALAGRGLPLAGVAVDTLLASYLCHPDQRSYDLADLSIRHLRRELRSEATADDGQGALDLSLDGTSPHHGTALRAAAVAELGDVLEEELADRGATQLLRDLELPLVDVLAGMERTGIAADRDYLDGLEREFAAAVADAAAEAYAVIGREVNLGSPKQLQEVLFDQLQMPKTKKIKTGWTTDAASLADLFERTQHPFLAHVLAHRDASRLRQTVEGLIRSIDDDGRIRTTFQQTIAATGRLSSTDPNLQNIPIRTEAGRQIRRAFVVGEGYDVLLTADYSQIEMRIMAHLSGDPGLIDAFRSGEDLHSYVGARVFGVATDEVTAAQRSKIKAMSYGLAYGLSSFGLSKQLNISVGEAAALMEDYFDRFGGVRTYLAGVVDEARRTGYTATILGRRRYLPDLTSDNRQRREMAERMALNAPIQGSAADLIKVAMLGVDRRLRDEGLRSRLLLQVHDELVLEVAPGERDAVEQLVRQEMGAAAPLSVPLDVSVGVGGSWHEAGH
ncbi:DNA polymerase I [Cellulomonas carbonis]|uniref:DNA polymerase I n=1 Tax=Cellulomonas carbonis T26 TaxID=947969 RepID=A0A0A0BVJ5_9CELL|nr:DNA polymerase I [Cellulomonas carbonis]KGM11951.1 DNA polymerase I [Cellulomonas carbonis T26]GGB95394.1 DNA polymerase (POL I) [Cellulomonas carbonis]